MKNIFLKQFITSIFIIFSIFACSSSDKDDNSNNSNNDKTSNIKIEINTSLTGDQIPSDFIGLSFETGSIRINNASMTGYFFSGNNAQSLHLFQQLGIKHLRIGGGSVDMNQSLPTYDDIDELFSFLKKSGIKVIYSFRLLNGDINENVKLAKYIWEKYNNYVDCFAIGNEPDWNSYHTQDPEIVDYPTYLIKWKEFALAIAKAIPNVKFTGPNTGSNYPVSGAKDTNYNGKSWTINFAHDLKSTGLISKVSQHNYVGQDASGMSPKEMIDNMLSSSWDNVQYQALYNATLEPLLAEGYSYRLAESNSFSGQSEGGSNCFATALFSLDYLHWWAEHKCGGVNFHNKQWVLNAPIGMDASGNLFVNPVGYGIMAFKLSGNGYIQPLTISKNDINITAYAVKNGENIFITLINKEHGTNAKNAKVSINLNGKVNKIETLTLQSPDNNPASLSASLGGATINNSDDWQGKWETHSNDNLIFDVKSSSALIVKIITK